MKISLQRRKTQKATYSKLEVSAAQFIPYEYHWDRETILTKKQEFVQILKLDGFAFETADDDDVDMKKLVRNSLLKSMADGTFAVWFHTLRRRQSAYPAGKQPPGFAAYVDKLWHEKHSNKNTYVNEIYITIVRKADTKGAAKVHHYLKKASEAGNKTAQIDALRDAQKELAETASRLAATFRDYGAR
ncbi:MAG: VirB4 family type IV secretion/conjugal transfer ATPase, partial [Proteobacteria bacterium]|nr:VirB4 family type IV secretion/conjugal transfer ATPase [Pseudomonadota bacterium]